MHLTCKSWPFLNLDLMFLGVNCIKASRVLYCIVCFVDCTGCTKSHVYKIMINQREHQNTKNSKQINCAK